MFSKNTHPKWWQLYLSLPLLIALFAADTRLKISARAHQAVQILIILFIYALISLWLRANSGAFSAMDRRGRDGSVRVLHIHPSHLPGSQDNRLIDLPHSEIRGMLNNTFEMDYTLHGHKLRFSHSKKTQFVTGALYIDAEFLPMNEDEIKERK